MRHIMVLLLLFVLKVSSAQLQFAIGTGTTGNSSSSYPCPMQDFYEGYRSQHLYLASELTAKGMVAGNITSLSFNVLNMNTFSGNIEGYTIRMGVTAGTALVSTSWIATGASLYGPVDYVPHLGNNTFNLSTPFTWNGTDNIVIEICNGLTANTTDGLTHQSQNPTVASHSTGITGHGLYKNNTGMLCDSSTTGSVMWATRPNIVFGLVPATACSGTPNAGTISSNISNACLQQVIQLTATGSQVAAGIDYQWQASINGGASWNDIPGINFQSAQATQVVTTQYQLRATCTNSGGLTSYSNILTVISPPFPSGNYTINKNAATTWPAVTTNANFVSFAEAYAALNCGITGPVVFNVVPGSGPYNEQLIVFGNITGASATNNITFNGNGNEITFNTSNFNERAVIKLRNAKHFIFDSLTLTSTGINYGYGVHLLENADSNTVRKCTINVSTTSTSNSFAGVILTSANLDGNTFEANNITGGYYGIYFNSTYVAGCNRSNKVIKNTVADFYLYGILVEATTNLLIEKNKIHRPLRTVVSSFNGVYISGQSDSVIVSKNRISNPFGGVPTSTATFTGIEMSVANSNQLTTHVVSNNLVVSENGTGLQIGIYCGLSSKTQIFHNTISLESTAGGTGGLYYGLNVSGTGVQVYNNNVSVTANGGTKAAIVIPYSPVPVSDRNNLYVGGTGTNYIGKFGSSNYYYDLYGWINASGQDYQSFVANPFFVSPSAPAYNYTPFSAFLDNRGFALGYTDDLLGNVRSSTRPDIGAYEFTGPDCVLPLVTAGALLDGAYKNQSICYNSYTSLSIASAINTNYSANTFWQWQTSPTANGVFVDYGAPTSNWNISVPVLADTTRYFRCAVSCSGNTVYTDTIKMDVKAQLMAGNYTINNNSPETYQPFYSGGNFQSYSTAIASMNACGISGPVVFNTVAGSGPYYEQFYIDSIKRSSATNTVTFNGNGTSLFYNSSVGFAVFNAMVVLRSSDFVTLDSLVIDARGSLGHAVALISHADNNTVKNCTIYSTASSTGTNISSILIGGSSGNPIILPSAAYADNNLFDQNIIVGGNYGIVLAGGTSGRITNNSFTNNTVKDFYSYGFYVAATNNTLIEGNFITRPTLVSPGLGYGIYTAQQPNNNLRILGNRITNFFGGTPGSTAGATGIYHNIGTTTGNENVVANNLIYQLGGKGQIRGIYNGNANYVHYLHNTIAFEDLSATGNTVDGFYLTGSASNILNNVLVKNNIVSLNNASPSAKHCLLITDIAANPISNFNDFIVLPSSVNSFVGGKNSLNYATLAAWQTATQRDTNSISLDPIYTNATLGNYQPTSLFADNRGTATSITSDIANNLRNNLTPDMGAYEFTPSACPSTLVGGTATVTPASGLCLQQPIRLSLSGYSYEGSVTFQWQNSSNGASGWTNIGQLQNTPILDTLSSSNTYYRCIVSCGAGTVFSSVVQAGLNTILTAGVYTINNAAPTTWPATGNNFHSFNEAATALRCGILGTVVFNVKAGTYNEQVKLTKIPGASATSTVQFRSETNVASSVVLTYSSPSSTSNYTLKLDSTNFVSIRSMTVAATNATYAKAVELAGTSSYDSIVNCIVTSVVGTNSSDINKSAIIGTNLTGKNIVIKGNNITNGNYGVYLLSNNGKTPHFVNFEIDSNTVSGSDYTAIYTWYGDSLHISRNILDIDAPNGLFYGISVQNSDSSVEINYNKLNVSNTVAGTFFGISLVNSYASSTGSYKVMSNDVLYNAGNASNGYGIYIAAPNCMVVNNVVSLNTSGNASGLYMLTNENNTIVNNTISTAAGSSTNCYSANFDINTLVNVNVVTVMNNIFTNNAGGKAMRVSSLASFNSDYNLLYTTGNALVKFNNTDYASLQAWRQLSYNDMNSISIAPAFAAGNNLKPDLTNGDVWAMHGRGKQLQGNDRDHDGLPRSTTLTSGVPDLGAYEFYPGSTPSVLQAVPTLPAPNTEQTFYFGTDTVMKIKWGPSVPASIQLRRYSGVVPAGVNSLGLDSMYFYVKADVPGNFSCDAKLFYLDSWLGNVQDVAQLGLGKTDASNAWAVNYLSRNDLSRKMIYQLNANYIDKFTGLKNRYAPVPFAANENSNTGKRFWVPYGHHQQMSDNSQDMLLYLSALDKPANVQVKVNGTTWVKNYKVAANTSVKTVTIPKTGIEDARLLNEGLYTKGISIESDVPINAYAHIYASANSGAAMLWPVDVWGYEYISLNASQLYAADCYSWINIMADHDSTLVEIIPSVITKTGKPANIPFTVTLKKGEVYQVMGTTSGSAGTDLTGSKIKSIANSTGSCYPIAVFSGSSRTQFCGMGGDQLIQQVFPYSAWGKDFLAFSAANSTSDTLYNSVQWRVLVKDTTTVVKHNGVALPLSSLIKPGNYYEVGLNAGKGRTTASYFQADKPVLVAQYMVQGSVGCNDLAATAGLGDPEIFYLTPLGQGINKAVIFGTADKAITSSYINAIVPTSAFNSFRINGANAFTDTFSHPHLSGYICIRQNILNNGKHVLACDSPFTAITYGVGSVESYGYNVGAKIKNKEGLSNDSGNYVCTNSLINFSVSLPVIPTLMVWKFSQSPSISPNTDISVNAPVPTDTVVVNGVTYYNFVLSTAHLFSVAGNYNIPVLYYHPDFEGCNNVATFILHPLVVSKPATGFNVNLVGCNPTNAQFNGPSLTSSGIGINQWIWTYHNNTNSSSQTSNFSYASAGNYPVKLTVQTADGCIGDSVQTVVVSCSVPLVLLDFQAKLDGKLVGLNWSTSNEINCRSFIVERSSDGLNWTVLGTIVARNIQGPNYYYLKDMLPMKGLNYYRLAMVDMDGKRTYSPIRQVNLYKEGMLFILTPNPASSYTMINFSEPTRNGHVELFNSMGNKVMDERIGNGNSIRSYRLNTYLLPAGIYLVKITSGNTSKTEMLQVDRR